MAFNVVGAGILDDLESMNQSVNQEKRTSAKGNYQNDLIGKRVLYEYKRRARRR